MLLIDNGDYYKDDFDDNHIDGVKMMRRWWLWCWFDNNHDNGVWWRSNRWFEDDSYAVDYLKMMVVMVLLVIARSICCHNQMKRIISIYDYSISYDDDYWWW